MQKSLEARDLTSGPILSQLVRLALPILGTSFVQMLYSFTDMAWLGRLSNEAVAAVGSVSLFAWLGNSFALTNKVGSEITIAHWIGKKSHDEASFYASQNSSMSFYLGTFLLLLYFVAAPFLLSIYALEKDILQMSVEYMRIISFGLPFVFMSYSFTGTYNACGHSQRPFMINSLGLVVNIILDPIFIFVLEMGTNGAAIATLLSQILVWALFFYYIRGKDKLLNRFKFITKLAWTPCRRILKIGSPAAALNALFAFVNMYMGRMASKVNGHIGLLTITTGGQLEGITWNTAQGFSTALGAFISQNYAAEAIERVKKGYKTTLLITMIFGVFSTLLYVFGGEAIFSIIVPERTAFEAGGVYLRINGYTQLFMMLEITTQGFFYGVGRSMIPASISIIGNYLRIPLAFATMYFIPGIEGLWWAIAISTILKGIASYIFYLKIRSKLLNK